MDTKTIIPISRAKKNPGREAGARFRRNRVRGLPLIRLILARTGGFPIS